MTNTRVVQFRWIYFLLAYMLSFTCATAKDNSNSRQAREIFDRTYNMVFGPNGCSLSYAVNIIGIYKTEGNIWYKGKKSKFIESRYAAWCDGKDLYRVDKKKKLVEIFNPQSPDPISMLANSSLIPTIIHITLRPRTMTLSLPSSLLKVLRV